MCRAEKEKTSHTPVMLLCLHLEDSSNHCSLLQYTKLNSCRVISKDAAFDYIGHKNAVLDQSHQVCLLFAVGFSPSVQKDKL